MALLRSITTVGGYTLLSRLLGFLRDVLFAAALGASTAADAFFVAFKFPNLFRRLFAEGAFSAAFVPMFAGLLTTAGEKPARRFAEASLAVLLAVLVVFVCILEILMPWLMLVIAPGFRADPGKFALAIDLTRITLPYLLFISLVALMGAILNAYDKFAAAAAAPVVLNLVLIAAALGWQLYTHTPARGLAWGIAVAGVLQFAWLGIALARHGFVMRLRWPRLTPDVKKLLRLMLPVAFGAGIYQINVVIDVIIASFLPTGSISYLYYADRVNQLPLGVIGIAVATALLPLMSRQIRAGNEAEALMSQNRAVEFAAFLTVPAAFALVAAAGPIVSGLFGRGLFGTAAQEATALALAAYALGLPAYVQVKVLSTAFFAREDTATPVKVGVVALFVNLGVALVLMWPLGHVGIALATSTAAWANAGLLAWLLGRRGRLAPDARLKRKLPRIALASVVMAGAVAGIVHSLPDAGSWAEGLRFAYLAALVGGGFVLYGALAFLGGAITRDELRAALTRNRGPEPGPGTGVA
jgi:putative peptidoglycan lipid II flippase